jgi:hypothetical protein
MDRPALEEERTVSTPAMPFTADSIGRVSRVSTSSGERPSALVCRLLSLLGLHRLGIERQRAGDHDVVGGIDPFAHHHPVALVGAGLHVNRVKGGVGLHEQQRLAIGIHQGSGGHGEAIGARFRPGRGHPQESIALGVAFHLAGIALLLKLIAMAHVGHGSRSDQGDAKQSGGREAGAGGKPQDPVAQNRAERELGGGWRSCDEKQVKSPALTSICRICIRP